MESPHERAVADGVKLRLRGLPHPHQHHGSGLDHRGRTGTMVDYRDRQTRKMRWEAPDEDVKYSADDLDRNVSR